MTNNFFKSTKNYLLSDGYRAALLYTKCAPLSRRLMKKPTCYLLINKSILTFLTLIVAYFVVMDMVLFVKAKHRATPSLTSHQEILLTAIMATPVLNTSSSVISHTQQPPYAHSIFSVFSPLPVKKIMMAEATHFVRSPLAELLEHAVGFSDLFPFVTANGISFVHAVLSVVSVRFLVHDSLFWRQTGVVIFQFRNFLDSFDGVIYRAHAKKTMYRSHYGSMGYFVDAFSDVFGGLCLVGALAIYFLRHRPRASSSQSKLMSNRCVRLVEASRLLDQSYLLNSLLLKKTTEKKRLQQHHRSLSYQQVPGGDGGGGGGGKDYYYHAAPTSSSAASSYDDSSAAVSPVSCSSCTSTTVPSPASSLSPLSQSQCSSMHCLVLSVPGGAAQQQHNPMQYDYDVEQQQQQLELQKQAFDHDQQQPSQHHKVSQAAILVSVALLGIRMAMSAAFWDRSVRTYEDLLDSPSKSELQQVRTAWKVHGL